MDGAGDRGEHVEPGVEGEFAPEFGPVDAYAYVYDEFVPGSGCDWRCCWVDWTRARARARTRARRTSRVIECECGCCSCSTTTTTTSDVVGSVDADAFFAILAGPFTAIKARARTWTWTWTWTLAYADDVVDGSYDHAKPGCACC